MRRHRLDWITSGLVAPLATTLVALAPPFVAFGVAVTSAALWCRWLEQHSESHGGTQGAART